MPLDLNLSASDANTALGLSLALALCLFALSWLVHALIWRIRLPAAYPVWLPIIFSVTPLVCVLLGWFWLPKEYSSAAVICFLFAVPVYVVISGCYMGGYAGVIEYSPSAEILKVVRKHMPGGLPTDLLQVDTLSEEALTGKRIRHLLKSNCAEQIGEEVALTDKGRRLIDLCMAYRQLLCLKGEPQG